MDEFILIFRHEDGLGELYKDIDNNKAKLNFQMALPLAKTQTDKKTIQKEIDKL